MEDQQPISENPQKEPIQQPTVSEQSVQSQPDENDVKENKIIALLSYIHILFLVPLLLKKESKFCQFHAKQGLVLFLVWIIAPFLTVVFGLGLLIMLVALVFSLMGIISVLNGQMKKLPLIGDFAEKFNL